MIFVHFLDAYKGKSRFVLEFVKRALIVERAAFGKRGESGSKIIALLFTRCRKFIVKKSL